MGNSASRKRTERELEALREKTDVLERRIDKLERSIRVMRNTDVKRTIDDITDALKEYHPKARELFHDLVNGRVPPIPLCKVMVSVDQV